MRSKKSVTRFACLSLVMIVITTCVSMSVSAIDSNDSAVIVYDPNSSIVHEVETLRTANSKQFLRSDGTYTMQIYGMPIHEQYNGSWREIDNRLYYKNGVYRTQGIEFNVALDTRKDSNNILTVSGGGKTATFKLVDDSDLPSKTLNEISTILKEKCGLTLSSDAIKIKHGSRAEIDIDDLECTAEALSASDVPVSSTTATCGGIFANSSVSSQYTTSTHALENKTIFNNRISAGALIYEVETDTVMAREFSDGTIALCDHKATPFFVLPQPRLIDADGNQSENVDAFAVYSEDKLYLVYALDTQWMSDQDTTYPVTLSAPLTYQASGSPTLDFYIRSDDAKNYVTRSADEKLYIGKDSDDISYRTYIKYDRLPSQVYTLTSDAIFSATLSLKYDISTTSGGNISLHNVTGQYVPECVDWATQPTFDAVAIDNCNFYSSSKVLSFDVRSWLMNAIDDPTSTTGLMLKYTNEALTTCNSFYSSESQADATNNIFVPSLSITYIRQGPDGAQSYTMSASAPPERVIRGSSFEIELTANPINIDLYSIQCTAASGITVEQIDTSPYTFRVSVLPTATLGSKTLTFKSYSFYNASNGSVTPDAVATVNFDVCEQSHYWYSQRSPYVAGSLNYYGTGDCTLSDIKINGKYIMHEKLSSSFTGEIYEYGCVLCSWSMLLRNLERKIETPAGWLDPKTGSKASLEYYYDPYYLLMYYLSWPEFSQKSATYSAANDFISISSYARFRSLGYHTTSSGINGTKYASDNYDFTKNEAATAAALKGYLDANPEGIAVRFDGHTEVISGYDPVKYAAGEYGDAFYVYDPGTVHATNGNGALLSGINYHNIRNLTTIKYIEWFD